MGTGKIIDKKAYNATEKLPRRVAEEIRNQEKSAEILIGWIQLSIVLFFGFLYSLVPRAEGSSGFNFVPYALGAYVIFTIIRLAISYKTLAPAWFLILSIIVDIALLCAIIFSFHIQYEQHPTFYLKASTLMYIFLFVALRALRFDPRFVIVSGVASILGWMTLVLYAVYSDMKGMHVTRNYVEYMTSNTILIGAEIDKIIIIAGVTAILTITLMRGRRLLFDAVRSTSAANDLSRFFSAEVVSSITDSDETLIAGQGITRQAAILFVDLRGFTKRASEMSPTMVMDLLHRYQKHVVPAIENAGGRVDKFMGDGILATFGAVSSSEYYAADALRAVEAVLDAGHAYNYELAQKDLADGMQIGCGVSAGTVIVGVVGVEKRLEFTVIGDPVNQAAKLEDMNKIEKTQALTTKVVYETACAQGYEPKIKPIIRTSRSIPGVNEPIDLVVLERVS